MAPQPRGPACLSSWKASLLLVNLSLSLSVSLSPTSSLPTALSPAPPPLLSITAKSQAAASVPWLCAPPPNSRHRHVTTAGQPGEVWEHLLWLVQGALRFLRWLPFLTPALVPRCCSVQDLPGPTQLARQQLPSFARWLPGA